MTSEQAVRARATMPAIPPGIVRAQDYEDFAAHCMAAPVHAWVASGGAREAALRANTEAFAAVRIVPRLLRTLSGGHTRVQLCGQILAHPLLLAPLASQTLLHAGGEPECARGAAAADAAMVVSTLSAFTLEDIAASASGPKWFQLYFQPRREDTLELLRRAEAAGYAAIVVTLDAPVQTPGVRALRAGFRPDMLPAAANLRARPPTPQAPLERGQSRVFHGAMRLAPGTAELDWLLRHSRLPVLVKGVLHADDARALRDAGVAGIVVSNHGGRALDDAPATLAVLPGIRAALDDDFPLLLDGSIRSGSDAFKAIALGADAVLVGRLQAYALAAAGALGVAHLLRLLREELELCMAQSGCATLADVRRAALLHPF